MRTRLALAAGTFAAFMMAAAPAFAQKQGGTLQHLPSRQPAQRLDPRGSDDLGQPAVHGGVQQSRDVRSQGEGQQPRPDRARPGRELVVERRQDQAHLQAAPGREVARRQAVHRHRREVHLGRADGQGRREARHHPQEPAQGLVHQPQGRDDQRRQRGDLRPRPAAALVPVDARRRLFAGLFLPRAAAATCAPSRSAPARSRSSSSSATNRSSWCAIPTTGRRAGPISTPSTGRSCPTAARACWASSPASST